MNNLKKSESEVIKILCQFVWRFAIVFSAKSPLNVIASLNIDLSDNFFSLVPNEIVN